jgi:uncharacterized LabA/DUF88 family protein
MEKLPDSFDQITEKSLKTLSKVHVAIFWDYENMPFPRQNPEKFLLALQNFIAAHNVKCAKVYLRKETISPTMLNMLHQIKSLKLKWITNARKNAVDNSLIISVRDVLNKNPKIQRILFLSGDGDFYRLFRELHSNKIKLSIVARHGNFHKKILSFRYRIYSIRHLLTFPENWWSHRKALQFKQDLINTEKIEIKSPKVWY